MQRKFTKIKNIKLPIISITLVSVLILVVYFGGSFSTLSQSSIEKHDMVTLNYQAWLSDSAKNYDPLNPILDKVLVIVIIPITEDPENGLILGLYNNIIGKEIYHESDLIWLDKCIDQDRDGIDDFTGKTALTYGNSTDQYYNTCLMIKFKVLSIQKNIIF